MQPHSSRVSWVVITMQSGITRIFTGIPCKTLKGAQASGEKITVDAGRNLTLESERDSDRYNAKQQNASAGGSFTLGSMTGSASVSASRDRPKSNFDSVKEQSGLFAGQGGYDVRVGEQTQLMAPSLPAPRTRTATALIPARWAGATSTTRRITAPRTAAAA